MKLFVWVKPYDVDYGSSMVFAVAENLDEAKRQAQGGTAWSFGEYDNRERCPYVALGEPTRVVELPCAEWHEWEE